MKLHSKQEEMSKIGRFICLYGPTMCGKTVTTLLTAPDPISYIRTEPRSLAPTFEVIDRERPDLDVDIGDYDTFPDLIEFVSNFNNFDRYNTLFFDSLSHLMNISLTQEVVDESWDAKDEKEKAKKALVNQVKVSLESQGGVNKNMFRLLNLLMNLSAKRGKIVVVSALVTENPKYNRALEAAPAFGGKEVPSNFPGFFDLIGFVRPRIKETVNENNEKVSEKIYPPWVSFDDANDPDETYVAKFTGTGKTEGPLNLMKILKWDETGGDETGGADNG